MEPSEGNFQLDWLEHAIRAAERHHIAVVLGTPSAAPPAWLTQKYPETLRTESNGRKDGHGNRQQFDWSDPKYRELARIIATKMAERFGHDPNVIGWQIDNEYANESYSDIDRGRFQNWLKAKYKTLDNLNKRWTTAYWSETYQSWDQIPIQSTYGNPGLLLNWREFVTDTWRSYQRNQLDAIRAHAEPRQRITTNMMGWFNAYDHYIVSSRPRLRQLGRLHRHRPDGPCRKRRAPRSHSRLPAQKFLGHGNAARLRELVAGQQRAQQR
jgi:beta-galactosidase